ncbi:MAG TPA: BlaI/MecI/CopY family transcriptional regulator [Flavitalea sp.]|nr:BlaI/MecI/CopY family transcriptional regulator [Flavitalea sp.]
MQDKLTQQEEEAMRVVWKLKEGNVKSFLENMPDESKPPYTTLASTIRNLEKKGYLQSRLIGNMYWYTPLIKESDFKKKSLGDMVKNHFDNSYKELVTFFAQQKKISPEELKDIVDLIEKKKK